MTEAMAEYRYTIPGEVPSKKNNPILRRTRNGILRLPGAKYQQWECNAVNLIKCSLQRPLKPLESASIVLTIYHGDLVRRDGDNELTSVQDMLMKAGVIVDDNWQRIGTPIVYHTIDPASPRIEIEIIEKPLVDWATKMKLLKKIRKMIVKETR